LVAVPDTVKVFSVAMIKLPFFELIKMLFRTADLSIT